MNRLYARRSIEQILEHMPIESLSTKRQRQLLCDYIGNSLFPDLRSRLWDIELVEEDHFAVHGNITSPFDLKALEKASEKLGESCDTSRVDILPNPEAKGHFGTVICAHCPIFQSPQNSERIDSVLYGEYLCLLFHEKEYSLVYSSSGYIGWAQNIDYHPIDANEWTTQLQYDRVFFVAPWSNDGVYIPRGSELPWLPSGECLLPTGSIISTPSKIAVRFSLKRSQQRAALEAIARSLQNVPYVWGGITPDGFDCSGFTSFVYRNIGIYLPRDADQQILMGKICAMPGITQGLITGDLLFFAGEFGGITHVGMAIGSDELIHADQESGVTITSLEQNSNLRRRFLLAKRLIR